MAKQTRKIQTNRSQNTKPVMIQCRTLVNRDAVTRKSIDGVEHIIVSSATLPDDIVMNGILYPAEEIAKSFGSLELTHAPIEHPFIDGQFVSAGDPRAMPNFYAGVYNMNVRHEDGRVHIDKFINVAEALKTDRGKRLLDRIGELENNSDPRPIHTSVGVFILDPEELSEPQTNADGDEFTVIARDMVFDHDAILLDSVGAAQPHQGVGVAVNRKGEKFIINNFDLNADDSTPPVKFGRLALLAGNAEHQSVTEMERSVLDSLERSAIDAHWIEELFPDEKLVIFWSKDQLFEVPFVIDSEGLATIVGIPLPVERSVAFTPKTNHSEGSAMKEMILNALKKANVETDGLSDDALFAAYNQLQANQSDSDNAESADDKDGLAAVVANALKPLTEKIDGLQAKINKTDDAELNRLAEIVGNSDKFQGLDVEAAKKLGIDTLKSMSANCATAFGVNAAFNAASADESHQAPADMPK